MQGEVLGHERIGAGPRKVVVLNDWMCDTSSWDAARPYLDGERFTWAFADLRGYGRSRERKGQHTVREGATDVVALADALGWARFATVGHSMSTLVALHLAQHHPDRVDRAVLLTPAPPASFGAPDALLASMQELARADVATRNEQLAQRFGDRLARNWASFKARRWHATTDPEAAAGYARMFGQEGLPDRTKRTAVPILALTGEQDIPPMRRDATTANLTPICDELEVVSFTDCGHYPMQEMPPRTVAVVERFLSTADA